MVCRSLLRLPFFVGLPNVSLDLTPVQSIDRGTGHNAERLQLKLVVSFSWILVMLALSTGMLNLVTLDKVSTSKSYTLESSLWNSSTTISICNQRNQQDPPFIYQTMAK